MAEVKLGANLWSQASDWPAFLEAGRQAERLGFDHLWTWDHVLAIFGDPSQPIFEGYTALAALAQATDRIGLGLFVGANTVRNPALAAKSVLTIDHISGGRAMCGLGGAWFEAEHRAFGIDFGSGFGQRLDWLGEAVPAVRAELDGERVTSEPGGRYAFDELLIQPLPIQAHLPIVIGGSGERKTLRIVALWADLWNAFGSPDRKSSDAAASQGWTKRCSRSSWSTRPLVHSSARRPPRPTPCSWWVSPMRARRHERSSARVMSRCSVGVLSMPASSTISVAPAPSS